MRPIRFARELKALRGSYRAMADEAALADDEASYKLTLTARGFSRRTRKVVDDKLSFSATLMRAGEVDAASRLLNEVQDEVRTEEVALLEQVNEVKVAQAVRREKMTRLRLVRLVAVATAGSMLMGLSALGMTAASFFDARRADAARVHGSLRLAGKEAQQRRARALAHKLMKGGNSKTVAGMLMKLSPQDLAMLALMTNQGAGTAALKNFLVAALPSPLAHKLVSTITGAVANATVVSVPSPKDAVAEGLEVVTHTKKKAAKEEEATKETADEEKDQSAEPADDGSKQPKDNPSDDPPPQDDENPPIPKPNPFGGGSNNNGGESNSSGGDDGDLLHP